MQVSYWHHFLSEKNQYADSILSEYLSKGAIAYVPALWHLEIRNILWNKEKKKQIPEGGTTEALNLMNQFALITDYSVGRPDAMENLDAIMKYHSLTSYDASYVELAVRLGLPLASLDQEMIRVARELGCFME